MTRVEASSRPTVGARRFGYLVAVTVNVLFLLAVNVWPGWQAVPFLTPDARLVIGLVNASITANLVVNVVYLLRDDPWLKALGDLVTLTVGLLALLRIWQVFPFDFAGTGFDWALVVRGLLGIAIFGSVVGIVGTGIRFAGHVRGGGAARTHPG